MVVELLLNRFMKSVKINNDLIQKYPHLLGKLRFGCVEAPDGWYDLIDAFCEELTMICEWKLTKDQTFWPEICIIKEKFGRLEIQGIDFKNIQNDDAVDTVLMRAHAMASFASRISRSICQYTGKPGVTCQKAGGWVATVDVTNPEFAEFKPFEKKTK